ncbi:hypothetical protein F8388_025007 [Cannabis sativa]|uniref:Amino acid transporter transmembrane domain-containing protein n=1 Tax=Cannabis sativa TaxID=3483 RepID=A0A7J6G3G6_CANSA|nr:hypothetical protein F8388_025007 [Cannabis sativa]
MMKHNELDDLAASGNDDYQVSDYDDDYYEGDEEEEEDDKDYQDLEAYNDTIVFCDDDDIDYTDNNVVSITAWPQSYRHVASTVDLPPSKQQSSSTAQALLNGINVLCGIGLLTTPYALREGGWLSLILLVGFSIIACYTGILLQRCLESNPGLKTFPDIGQAAFGRAGRLAIAGSCVEFITMISDNMTSVLSNNISMSLEGIFDLSSHQIFAISATLVILPTVWLKNLSLLSYFSIGGVVHQYWWHFACCGLVW